MRWTRQIKARLDGLGDAGLADAAGDGAALHMGRALAGGDAQGFQAAQGVRHDDARAAFNRVFDQGGRSARCEGAAGELMPVAFALQRQKQIAGDDLAAAVGQARDRAIVARSTPPVAAATSAADQSGRAECSGIERQGLGRDSGVVEGVGHARDDLTLFMPFSGDDHHIPVTHHFDGGLDGGAAVTDLDPVRTAGADLGADGGGVFGPRIVVGDDGDVGQTPGDLAHQGRLPRSRLPPAPKTTISRPVA